MTKEEWLNKYDSSRKYIEQTCRHELFAAMDSYAKEQAMAFFNYCFKTSTMFDGKLAERYDKFIENQFIEQQNKP